MFPISDKWNRQNSRAKYYSTTFHVRCEFDWLAKHRPKLMTSVKDTLATKAKMKSLENDQKMTSNRTRTWMRTQRQMSKKSDGQTRSTATIVAGSPQKWSLIFFSVASRWYAKFSVAKLHRAYLQLYVYFINRPTLHLYQISNAIWKDTEKKHNAQGSNLRSRRGTWIKVKN